MRRLMEGAMDHLRVSLLEACDLSPTGAITLDEFITVCPELPCNVQHPIVLPRRGDLVRFVRRHPDQFCFDASTYTVRRAQRSWNQQQA